MEVIEIAISDFELLSWLQPHTTKTVYKFNKKRFPFFFREVDVIVKDKGIDNALVQFKAKDIVINDRIEIPCCPNELFQVTEVVYNIDSNTYIARPHKYHLHTWKDDVLPTIVKIYR